MDSFEELSTCRQSSFGIGAIPFTAIVEYSKIYKIEDFEEFLYLIRRMDKAYIQAHEQKEKPAPTPKTSPKPKRK